MTLLAYIGLCVVLGVVAYLVQIAPFVHEKVKPIIVWIIIVVLVLVLITAIFGGIPDMKIPSIK